MNKDNNIFLLVASWFNYFIGTLELEPILSGFAYFFSIIGSIVYIYTTIKKYKNEKID
jgi:hypothetical protein